MVDAPIGKRTTHGKPIDKAGSAGFTIRGWKGIALRLEVSVRTAQRLEKRFGLPVFRKFGRACVREAAVEKWMEEHWGAAIVVE